MMRGATEQPEKQDLKSNKTTRPSAYSSVNNNRKQTISQIVKVEPGSENSTVMISSDSVFTTAGPSKILIAQNKINTGDSVFSINEMGSISIT